MILYKLALKNVRTQFQSYFMYVVSMAFSVMIYYSFVVIGENHAFGKEIEQSLNIKSAFQGSRVIILLFITVFMFSANSFFLKKRKQEIGLYNLLGMKRGQIAYLLFIENIVIGIVGLAIGIISGMLFSKLFSMILVGFMHLSIDSNFVFSLEAIKKTSLMFCCVLLLISLRSASVVYRYRLVQLFKASDVGEKLKPVTIFTWFFGILGIGLIVYGYYNAAHFLDYQKLLRKMSNNDVALFRGAFNLLFFCVVGTYLFFHNFLQILLTTLQKIKSYYYRDIHMVTTGNLRFNVKKNATTLATIAVLLGTALAALGGAVGLQAFMIKGTDRMSLVAYSVSDEYGKAVDQDINQVKGYQVSSKVEVKVKQVIGHLEKSSFNDNTDYLGIFSVISFATYKEVLQEAKQSEVPSLKNEEDVLLLVNMASESERELKDVGKEIRLADYSKAFHVADVLEDNIGGIGGARYNFPTLIVKDTKFKQLTNNEAYSYTMMNVKPPDYSGKLYQQIEDKLPQKKYTIDVEGVKVQDNIVTGKILPEKVVATDTFVPKIRYSCVARYPVLQSNQAQSGLFVYIALFLSVVFLFATGSIITLNQLTEAEEEKQRYQLLQKIGVSEKRIKKSIYKQNLFVFALPLVIALGHARYALKTLSYILPFPKSDLILFSQVLMIVLYVFFYLFTSSKYNNIVNNI